MAPTVEAPFTFFQKPIKTAFRDTIETPQMTFRLIPEVLDAVDVMAVFANEHLAVIHTPMMKLRHIQHVIDLEAVRVHNAVGQCFLADDGDQRRGLGVWNDGGVHLPPRFNKPKTGTFPAAPRPLRPLRTPPK